MSKSEPDEVFHLQLENGQDVEVSWYKHFDSHVDHLEFRGPMTDTGYLSHFVLKEKDDELDRDLLIDHAQAVMQARWNQRNGQPAQVALF